MAWTQNKSERNKITTRQSRSIHEKKPTKIRKRTTTVPGSHAIFVKVYREFISSTLNFIDETDQIDMDTRIHKGIEQIEKANKTTTRHGTLQLKQRKT